MNTFRSKTAPVRHAPEHGVALVLTLLLISMLVVVVVGFVSVSRLEQIAARNATYQSAAREMAQLATGQALARLTEAMQSEAAAAIYATQPGMLHALGGASESLYSQGATGFNINAVTTNGFVTGVAADNIQVGWTDVQNEEGQVIGRTAFYVSDETIKLPVNHARGQRPSFNPVPPRPFSIAGLDANVESNTITAFDAVVLGNFNNNNATISNWSFFFTPEQLTNAVSGIATVRGRRATVALENNPALAQRTPWGTDKVLINQLPLTDESVEALAGALTDAKLTEIFGGHFGDKYGETGVQSLAANLLQLRSDHWAGGVNFDGSDPVLGTADLGGQVATPPEAGLLKKNNGIPAETFGYVPFPMLNEVGLSFVFGWQQEDRLTVRVMLEAELFNPYPVAYPGGGQIYAQIDKARFLTDYQAPPGEEWRGPNGTSQGEAPHNDMYFGQGQDPWGSAASGPTWWGPPGAATVLDPPLGHQAAPIPQVPAGGYAVETLFFDVTFTDTNPTVSVTEMYVIIDQIKLLAEAGDPTSIRDWCSGNDFFNALAQSAQGPAQFQLPVGPASGPFGSPEDPIALPEFPPGQTVSLIKIDPRMRAPLDVSAGYQQTPPGQVWIQAPGATLGATNSVGPADFLEGPIVADPAFTNNLTRAVYNPAIPPINLLASGNFSAAPDLGKVFTGMPWRTLRMQPQPPEEVADGLIPDWVLLDMVDFSDGNSAFTPVNPNVRYASAGTAPVADFGAGMRALLGALTKTDATLPLADPANPGAAISTNTFSMTNFSLLQTGISNLVTAAGQPEEAANWARPAGGWRARREALGFPARALLLPSEVTEINGFANYNSLPDEFKKNEYRLGALFPGLGTRSRFFKIYAVGQAIEGANTANMAAVSLLQTLVEVDDSTTPASVRTVYQYPPAD